VAEIAESKGLWQTPSLEKAQAIFARPWLSHKLRFAINAAAIESIRGGTCNPNVAYDHAVLANSCEENSEMRGMAEAEIASSNVA